MASPFSDRERLLLGAALCLDPEIAIANWERWASRIALEDAPYPELRLLTAVYANLSRIAGQIRLPSKLKGKARATFIQNNLFARESLPTIEALSEKSAVLIAKGLAMCIRFDAWSSRTMGDADIHIPAASLEMAADVLAQLGWTPRYGMTWKSLVLRTASRRSSWNFIKGEACLDLHWRPQPETTSEEIIRRMWATSEPHVCLGRTVYLQSAEYALATSLAHGFKYGTHGDKLQTLVDAAKLLPACKPDVLQPLIGELDLRGALRNVVSGLEEVGVVFPDLPASGTGVDYGVRRFDREPGIVRSAPSTGLARPRDTPLLRNPGLYRLWSATGRKARIERLLLRRTGPFSKPLEQADTFADDYDLSDCKVMDRLAGPGWGWPEPDATGFWSDCADSRLLIPLRGREEHMVVLGLAEIRVGSPNATVNVFTNGHFMTRMNLDRDVATSQYCFFIPRTILTGPWVELSFRPAHYRGPERILPETYGLTRSVPVCRLRVYDAPEAHRILSREDFPQLYTRILSGDEPEASKFTRIRGRFKNSPYRANMSLPADFDPVFYVLAHGDLFEAEVDPYEHFVVHGKSEGRRWR